MRKIRALAVVVAVVAVVGGACSSPDAVDEVGVVATTPAETEPVQDNEVIPVADDEAEEALRRYEEEDRLPVGDAEGSIVGYMNYTEYYAGNQDPVFIDVRSYDDDTLIGYRVRFVGFVPLDELTGEGTVAERVEALFGETQAAHQERLDQQNDLLNSLTAEQLTELLEAEAE